VCTHLQVLLFQNVLASTTVHEFQKACNQDTEDKDGKPVDNLYTLSAITGQNVLFTNSTSHR
jgi:hypothetical protein